MRNQPVVVIAGPTCTGKSTLARALAEQISAEYLSQDDILTEIIPDSDRNLKDRLKSYDEMFKRARQAFLDGQSIVLEGTFSRIEHRAGLIRALPDARVIVIELQVPLEVALDRFADRKDHPASDLTSKIVEDRNRDYPYSPGVARLDGTSSLDKQLIRALGIAKSGAFHDIDAWKSIGLKSPEIGRAF